MGHGEVGQGWDVGHGDGGHREVGQGWDGGHGWDGGMGGEVGHVAHTTKQTGLRRQGYALNSVL